MPTGRPAQAGFTYLILLFAVAVLGIGLAAVGTVWKTGERREREAELLFVGHQYRQALASYYQRSPGGVKRYPKSLEELLRDPRFPNTVRHLRRLYPDPITAGTEWGLVKEPDGGIRGVYSRSEETPFKTAGFARRDAALEGRTRYSEWHFLANPPETAPAARPGQAGAAAPPPGAPRD